jgi:hypothetical protein
MKRNLKATCTFEASIKQSYEGLMKNKLRKLGFSQNQSVVSKVVDRLQGVLSLQASAFTPDDLQL